MKGIKIALIVGMAAVALTLVLTTRTVYAIDHIAYLAPAESMAVETGGGEYPAVLMAPTKFDSGRIELLPPDESVVETGGGEYPAVLMAPTKFDSDCIELLPAAK